jgi:hypothetical protein
LIRSVIVPSVFCASFDIIVASAIYPAFKLPKFNIHKKGNEDESIVLE